MMSGAAAKTEKKIKKKCGIVVDFDECKGCYLCIHVCPKQNIIKSKKLNAKGYHPAEQGAEGVCAGCELCMLVCPDMAIEVYDED